MGDNTSLTLTVLVIVLLITIVSVLALCLLVLHKLWEQALSVQYLINQLKGMVSEGKMPRPINEASRALESPTVEATNLAWPLPAQAPLRAARPPPLYRQGSPHGEPKTSRLDGYEGVRSSSPGSFF